MWTDWRFYTLAVSLAITFYSAGIYFDYFPRPSMSGSLDYVKSSTSYIIETIKIGLVVNEGGVNF